MFHLIWYALIGLIAGVIAKIGDARAHNDRLDDRARYHRIDPWAAPLPTCSRARQTNDIIPPASFFLHWARFCFSSFAISLKFIFPNETSDRALAGVPCASQPAVFAGDTATRLG